MIKQVTETMIVKWCRLGGAMQEVELPVGSTVQDFLEKAGLSLGSNESLFVDGQKADPQDELQDGDLVQVVGNKQGGNA